MYGIKHLSTMGAENHPSWNATSTMDVPTNQKNKETATEINASKDKKKRISANCRNDELKS